MVQSLARGIEILSILERRESATLGEIAQELSVDKSTASRLVQTLKEYDMVRVDPVSRKYRLGFRILFLGEGIRNNMDVTSIARPYISKAMEELGESVHLAAISNRRPYIIDQVRSKKEYDLSAQIGMIEPWHCSSVGKCILSYRSPAYVEQILAENELVRYTDHTITEPARLYEELTKIREKGYAMDDEERSWGVRCIAVPIFNYGGRVNYSIGISAPKDQLTQERLSAVVHQMKKYGNKISRELGYGMFKN